MESNFSIWMQKYNKLSLKEKAKKTINDRREKGRQTLFDKGRRMNISDLSQGWDVTEVVSNKTDQSRQQRRQALKEWKEKKEKELREKKLKQKPIFKVYHVPVEIGPPNLEFINKTIKGKRFDTKKKRNVGLNINENSHSPGIASRLRSKSKVIVNELQCSNINLPTSSSINSTLQKESKTIKKETPDETNNFELDEKKDIKPNSSRKSARHSNKHCTPINEPTVVNNSYTPPSKQELATAYISPFVTISRGKNSARKEFKSRRSQGGLFDKSDQLAVMTGNEAGAAHFHQLLNNEVEKIENMCDHWLKYKDEEGPPEEACDMINTAIGQSRLLLSKKFNQFRTLIEDCETQNAKRTVTCVDLHGYWEMMYLQVENLNKRFENLEKMRDNNWMEILPVENKPKPKKKGVKKAAKPRAESTLRNLIKAKRQETKENIPIIQNNSPLIIIPGMGRTSEFGSVRRSSRRLMSMGSARRKTISANSTPGTRSILKTPNTKSKTKKLVFFESSPVAIDTSPMILFSPAVKQRRSSRARKIHQD